MLRHILKQRGQYNCRPLQREVCSQKFANSAEEQGRLMFQ